MVNYNDGKWHGWNGGECPVHPESVVECVVLCSDGPSEGLGATKAKGYTWKNNHDSPIIAFRVIKEQKEPREFWVVEGGYMSYAGFALESAANHCASVHGGKVIHVREVQQ